MQECENKRFSCDVKPTQMEGTSKFRHSTDSIIYDNTVIFKHFCTNKGMIAIQQLETLKNQVRPIPACIFRDNALIDNVIAVNPFAFWILFFAHCLYFCLLHSLVQLSEKCPIYRSLGI